MRCARVLEQEPNLVIKQAEVIDLLLWNAADDRARAERVVGVQLLDGRTIGAEAVVVTTGTFLNGLVHIGERRYAGGTEWGAGLRDAR